jgi:hypothetical protein
MKLLATLVLLLVPTTALAQTVPFGKNKIQYRNFDWRVLSGEHVDVYYYPEAETLARLTLVHAEETVDHLAPRFQYHPFERIPLIVYSSDRHFEQTNVYPGFIPEGVLGFTEYLKRRVALPFRGDYAQFLQTLRHELVHYFQISKLADVDRLHGRTRAASPQNVHWWTEGLAEYFSTEMPTVHRMYVRDMVLNGRIPSIPQFSRMYSFASYPLGAELHRYLAERFGERYILEMYEKHWKYESFEEALAAILDVNLTQLSREWEYDLQQRYFPVYNERKPLEVGARPIIQRGGSNVKPALHIRSDDEPAELRRFGTREEEELDILLCVRGSPERRERLGRRRPVRLVGTPIRVPAPDGLVQGVDTRVSGCELDAGDSRIGCGAGKSRRRSRRRGTGRPARPGRRLLEPALEQGHLWVVGVGSRGQDHVLQCAAEAYVHLAQVRVEGAEPPGRVRMQVDVGFRHPEQPGLGVVGVGREDRGADQRQGPLGRIAAPVVPRLVRRAAPPDDDALGPRPP